MTINLEKSLIRNKRKLLTKEEILVLDKMEKIESNSELLKLRSKLGLWESNTETAKAARAKLTMKDKYQADRVFSESDIKSLCLKYGLRFLPSQYFNGELDNELPSKIKQFESKYSVNVNKYNSYIAAPTASFKLQKRPKDPLFFVELEDDRYYSERKEKHFFLVHKWGKDISILRWIANLPMRTSVTANGSVLALGFLVSMLMAYSSDPRFGMACVMGLMGSALTVLGIMIFNLFKDMFTGNFTEPFIRGNDDTWNDQYID